MSKQKLIAIIVVLAALGAGTYFLWSRGGLKSLNFQSLNPEDQRQISVPASDESADMSETYTSPDYSFSFKYPKGFNATELSDDNGDTVLVQKPEEKSGFQIYITPFDEAEPLTAARILQDMPASEVIDPKDVLMGEEKTINAVIFLSTNSSFGKTREVWFVRDGFLYQVTTYEGQDNFIGPILETWKFQ
ncbi:MAG: hypothetical protein A3H71_01280 [Candidatus Sungbacteria bacterium RIFCSPLOWO2_02_FULL_48_13b]|uniref:Uncharacterized protein n=1 Tax=Candidatus Sungbacteria bacterium RIFCSPLOWO2_02_FULL_48_13b TaxID=1802283 RepID=A0A1G2LIR7_9BACT|nr:MAG: hypothetical protein A3H71_01280 [Candidatus Sungbacteria bacterium RIFCSPLOWO2_02_FULL_48_13b]